MKSTFATELFVKLFGVMPPTKGGKKKTKAPKTEVMVPNRSAEPGGKVIYHVIPRRKDDRWNIKKEGGSRPSAVCDTKDEAVRRARELAQNQGWSQVIVHNKDGKIANEFNYGERTEGSDTPAPEPADKPEAKTERPTAKIDKDAPSPGRKTTKRVVYHVTPRSDDGKWRVKRENSQKPTRVLDKKEDAVQAAKELAKNKQEGQVIIHRKDGTIAEEFKYGGD